MSAPPSYKELSNVVSDYLTKGSEVQGVLLDAKEDGTGNCLCAFPYAAKGIVGAHLVYECPAYHTTIKSKISGAFTSWNSYLPTIIYKTKINGTADTVEVDTAAQTVKIGVKHAAANFSCKTLADGMVTDANVTTRLAEQVYAGLSLQYDPKRSGVRDLTAVAVRYGCPNVFKGDILAKYSLSQGYGIHMRLPLHQYADAAIAAEQQRFVAGVQARSPCGASFMLNANLTEGTYTSTLSRGIGDIWRFTLTMTAPFSREGGAAPRYGLKFTHVDCTE